MLLRLIRFKESDYGTQGILLLDEVFFCYTLEMPWKDNQVNISCIPVGKYKLKTHLFKGRRKCFELTDVPGRTHILIHPGNIAGDITKGLQSDVRGCILIGRRWGKIEGQTAVLQSAYTLKNLLGKIGWEDDKHEIIIEATDCERYKI